MEGNYKPYDYQKSAQRIKDILALPAGSFDDVDILPNRDRLTFSNGFYAYCTAIFIDIRESSKLPDVHLRPVLAKIYRAFVSEMVAVVNSIPEICEVNIEGDCVWAVYKTPYQSDINAVFSIMSIANTLVELLNHYLKANSISTIKVGIGAEYGRALMVKAGYEGSGINDVVYMGDVVNKAAHLANEAGKNWNDPLFVGDIFYSNLNEHNQGLLTRQYRNGDYYYSGNVVNTAMNEWVSDLP